MHTAAQARVLNATLRWVNRMVLRENLCPYAHPVARRREALSAVVASPRTTSDLLSTISKQCRALARGPAETVLIALAPEPGTLGEALEADFPAFLSLGWAVEEHVAEVAPSAVQLAFFHPRAVRSLYSASPEEDASDYAIRSPFPTVHLLRTADVEAVSPDNAAAVPERNSAHLRETLGVPMLRATLAELRDDSVPART